MKRFIFLTLLFPVMLSAQESFNMTLISNLDLPNLPTRSGLEYNDCWGFRHANGTEIAILGGVEDIFFIDVTEPGNPEVIYTHHVLNQPSGTTNQSIWRDFKTYGNYAYASADEGTSGLLIFDLSQVPNSVSFVTQTVQFWNRAHNIFIDEQNHKLYAAGSNSVNNGLVILDLNIPANPTTVWNVPLNTAGGGYVHDVHVRDNIAYCSHGSLQKIQIYDFSNLPAFSVVGSIENYPEAGYNHSSWLNGEGNLLAMCDETHGSDVKLVDVSDPENISNDDIHTFYSELLGPSAPGASIPHNPFILGDLAYIAYYHDGVQIFDISNPANITNIAYYDTYPDNVDYNGYNGCWGVYPFLPSGIIIASDENYGLYVLEITNPPLGIQFLSFRASRTDHSIQLDWSVTEATDGDQFAIQRSTDGGITFNTVGKVSLLDGQSNYSYLDRDVAESVKYVYRIDFLHWDGSHISSSLQLVRPISTKQIFRVSNPFTSEITIDALQPVDDLEVTLYNIEGQVIWSRYVQVADSHMTFPTDGIAAGSYILTMETSSADQRENLIVQKTQ